MAYVTHIVDFEKFPAEKEQSVASNIRSHFKHVSDAGRCSVYENGDAQIVLLGSGLILQAEHFQLSRYLELIGLAD